MNVYFLLLLIMLILLYGGIINSLIYVPKKIKIISLITLILMLARYIALIILFLVKNQVYLYFLKPMIFINLLCIPICGVISVFIFARNSKTKFKNILFICSVLSLSYCLIIYKSPAKINITNYYGYAMELQLQGYCYIVFLIINTILAVKGIELFNKTYSNKIGALLIIISSCITVVSVILTSRNIDFIWLVLLGDICWITTLDYGLLKLKR